MPFGLRKGDTDKDLDAKKASLFGKKSSKAGSPAPANPYAAAPPSSSNPYANQQSANNPYASHQSANDPYARSQSSLTQPPTSSLGSLTLNDERGTLPDYRSPSPQPSQYGGMPPPGYGGGSAKFQNSGSYGQTSGYGSNPYGGPSQSRGPSGYGGLGRTTSQDTVSTDAGRNALFGDAASRATQNKAATPPQDNGDYSYSTAGGYNSSELHGGYGAGPAREMTAEEQEEEDVNTAKQEIRFIKQQDVSSTRNIRRMAEEMGNTTDSTLMRLGQQGERIFNTERNLDSASNQNRLAEEKARELKTLNRSMFAVHVANPFTAKKREEAANALAVEKNQQQREQRDQTAAFAYQSQALTDKQQRDFNGNPIRQPAGAKNLAERAKYQFEADESDEEKEAEIEENLDVAYQMVKRNHMKAKAMGETIDEQNKHLDRIIKKSDKVDDQIAVNRARLDRIR